MNIASGKKGTKRQIRPLYRYRSKKTHTSKREKIYTKKRGGIDLMIIPA
jgi:hypothetical protein